MASSSRNITLSVFDRLLDYDPDMTADPKINQQERQQLQRQRRDGIRRDLEVLLNTQQPLHDESKGLPEITTSLLKYGTPGFHGLMLATRQQRLELAKSVKEVVDTFEPRLAKVQVELGEDAADESRTLRLRIKAQILAVDGEESVVFDTTLDPAIRQFKIKS